MTIPIEIYTVKLMVCSNDYDYDKITGISTGIAQLVHDVSSNIPLTQHELLECQEKYNQYSKEYHLQAVIEYYVPLIGGNNHTWGLYRPEKILNFERTLQDALSIATEDMVDYVLK